MKTKRTVKETIELFQLYADDYFKKAHRATATVDQATFYAKAEAYENAAFELEHNLASLQEERNVKLVSNQLTVNRPLKIRNE